MTIMQTVKIPFISYAHEDAEAARRLWADLISAGADPWLDTEKLLGGQDWETAIRKAIREATHFIALISKNSVNKRGFVQKELRHALEVLGEFPSNQIFVVPVRLDSSDPQDEQLRRLHRIDLFPDYSQGLKRICDSLGITPAPPATKLPISAPVNPRQQDTSDDVIDGIRARAAKQFPDDFSTQKYVIDTELNAWRELQTFSAPDVPQELANAILEHARQKFPEDFSTCLYLANSEADAWRKLQSLNAPDIPAATLQRILAKAGRDFPRDFSTQMYVIQTEIAAWRDLNSSSS